MTLAKHAGETFEPGKLNEGCLILAVDSSIIAIGFVLYQVLCRDDKELAAPLRNLATDEEYTAATRISSGKDLETRKPNARNRESNKRDNPTIYTAGEALHKDGEIREAQYNVDNYQDAQLQNIAKFLQTGKIPGSVGNHKSFKQTAKKFFIHKDAAWQQGRDHARKVIISPHRRDAIIREARDNSGHGGWDPTYKKIVDSYYWPKLMNQVVAYVRTCKRCQLHLTYYLKIRINPTWVPTVLRKFNMDLVDMGIRSNGYQYIADMHDDLSGWLESRMLTRKTSDDIADFLWQDIICHFGCIPQISTDNRTEFKKAVDTLTRRYGTNLVRISPHNLAANRMIERGHQTWINSIWKLCGSRKHKWSKWVYPALWADRVTTRRATGYSPYYLLYGKPHLFPFNIQDKFWFTINWHNVDSTEDLLAIRVLQIHKMHVNRNHAAMMNRDQCIAAAEHHAIRNACQPISGIYRPSEFVIVALKGPGIVRDQNMPESNDTWVGPFKVVRCFKSGSYELSELDGARIKGSMPVAHLKPFYTHQAQVINKEMIASDGSSDGEHQFYPSSAEDNKHESDYKPEITPQQK